MLRAAGKKQRHDGHDLLQSEAVKDARGMHVVSRAP